MIRLALTFCGLHPDGMKLKQIADKLTERGLPTKTGKSDRWTHQAVARILSRSSFDLHA